MIATLKNEGLLTSKRGYYPTPKLIEAYQVTNGFTEIPNFNGDNGVNGDKKEPPTPNSRDKNQNRTINLEKGQQQLENGDRGVYSETVKPVKSVKNNEQKQAEESESHVSDSYRELQCCFCNKPIMESKGWTSDDFTSGKPAHTACYDAKKDELAAQDRGGS